MPFKSSSILLTLIFSSIAFSLNAEYALAGQSRDYYSEGMEELESGNPTRALDIWLEAYQEIKSPLNIDPRIGSSFTEVVTRYKMKRLYRLASQIYYWSLDSRGGAELAEYLKTEIEKSLPLFETDLAKKLLKRSQKEPYLVAGIVKSYWQSLDPTPDTPENERLIEHWERILYSKNHFKKNDNTVFGTDDRTLTYIKYGNPTRKHNGQLKYDEFFMETVAEDIMREIGTVSVVSDITGQYETSLVPSENSAKIDKLLVVTSQYYHHSPYEIWIYENLSSSGNVIKIFGESEISGEYGEINSLGEFVPMRAFRKSLGVDYVTSAGYQSTLTPGALLLHNYYYQFLTYDDTFSGAFQSINAGLLHSSYPLGSTWFMSQTQKIEQEKNLVEWHAPAEQTELLSDIAKFDVKAREYLFYGEDNEPYYYYVMDSYPQSFLMYFMAETDEEDLAYKLNHNLSVVNYNGETISPVNHSPSIPLSRTTDFFPAQSVFKLPYNPVDLSLHYSAQLYANVQTSEIKQNLLPETLQAWGKTVSEVAEIKEKPAELQLSDIMIGYQLDEGDWQYDIPFTISVENKIPYPASVFVFFEAVNVERQASGNTRLEVEILIRKKEKGVLKKLFKEEPKNTISIMLEEPSSRIQQSLEVEMAEQQPGEYELIMEITDRISGTSLSKKVHFEVVEINNP